MNPNRYEKANVLSSGNKDNNNNNKKSTLTINKNQEPTRIVQNTNDNHHLASAVKYFNTLNELVTYFIKLRTNPVLELEKAIVQMKEIVKKRKHELKDQINYEVLIMVKYLERFRSQCNNNVNRYELSQELANIKKEESRYQEVLINMETLLRAKNPITDIGKWQDIEKDVTENCRKMNKIIEFKRKKLFNEALNFHENLVENFTVKTLESLNFKLSKEQFKL